MKILSKIVYKKYLLIIIIVILNYVTNIHAKETYNVAVLNFEAKSISKAYSNRIRNYLEMSLFNSDYFQILEREQINRIFNEQKFNRINNKQNNIIKLGKSISADYLIVGSIDKINNFSISLRVVSVNDGKIISVYIEEFKNVTDIKKITAQLSNKISKDIVNNINKKRLTPLIDFYVSTNIKYLYPVGILANLIEPGFGAGFEVGMKNFLLKDLRLGMESNYYYFDGKVNSTDKCKFIPIFINLEYRQLYNKIYFAPLFSAGMTYVSFRHKEDKGFKMNENSKIVNWEPIVKTGIKMGYNLTNNFDMFIGFEYNAIIEQERLVSFLAIEAGLSFLF